MCYKEDYVKDFLAEAKPTSWNYLKFDKLKIISACVICVMSTFALTYTSKFNFVRLFNIYFLFICNSCAVKHAL